MPILYKRMNPQTVAYELFDIDKLDAGPRLIKESRQREAEQQEAARLREIEAHRQAQLDPDYVLDMLNRSTVRSMETSASIPVVPTPTPKTKITAGTIALAISEIGIILLLLSVMVAALFV